MSQLRTLYHLMRADFLERVRRYSFLVTLFVIVVVTYLYLPALDTPAWFYLNMGGSRPIYNSAWIGLAVAALMTEFFPLFGFYLVKNTLERDRRTGVGEIIATTPLSKPMYTLGKWLSNMAVFGAVIAVTFLTSLVLQFVRAEEFAVDLWRSLRRSCCSFCPSSRLSRRWPSCSKASTGCAAGSAIWSTMWCMPPLFCSETCRALAACGPASTQACSASLDQCKTGRQIDIGGEPLLNLPTFRYDGINWTAEIIWPRLAWIVVSVAVALLAAFFFHRFDPVKVGKTLFADLVGWIKPMVLAFVTEPRPARGRAGRDRRACASRHATGEATVAPYRPRPYIPQPEPEERRSTRGCLRRSCA